MNKLLNTGLKNWKTTLFGIVAFLMGLPGLVGAVTAWGSHQPVDWRNVLVSVGLCSAAAIGALAKDSTTHSTPAEIKQSAVEEAANKPGFDMSAAHPTQGSK